MRIANLVTVSSATKNVNGWSKSLLALGGTDCCVFNLIKINQETVEIVGLDVEASFDFDWGKSEIGGVAFAQNDGNKNLNRK